MNKILLPSLVLLLFVSVIFTRCSKTLNPNPSTTDYLRTGRWKMSAATVMMKIPDGRDTTINYMSLMPACRLDDYITFDSLNRGFVHNGGVSCSAGDADSIGFVWSITNNNTVMSIYNGFTLIDSVAQLV